MKKHFFFCCCLFIPLFAQTESDFLTQHRLKIQQYQAKLEKLRNRAFKKEIAVGMKTKEEFRAYMHAFLEKEIAPEQNHFLSQTFQWLGLGGADFDYRKKLLDIFESEAIAFYDIYGKSFFFLKKNLDDHQIAPIIIHELQHGLQDQYYPLESYFQTALQSQSEDLLVALRFLIEGEASLVMNWYTLELQYPNRSMPEVLHHLLSLQIEGDSEETDPQSTLNIQDYFMSTLCAPYFQGMFAVSQAYQKGSWALVDQLFLSPPTTTEQMLHFQTKYLQQRDHPTQITWNDSSVCEFLNQGLSPEKKKGSFSADARTTFGEFGLYNLFHHLLKNRKQALSLSEGWDGDLFQALKQEDLSAFFWILTFDTEKDAEEALEGFSTLIALWKKQSSSLEHRVSRQHKEIILTAIEPALAELFHQQMKAHYQLTEDRRGFHLMRQTCPQCRSIHIIPIVYGMPDQELVEQAKQGEVFLGGCCIEATQYHCRDCLKQW